MAGENNDSVVSEMSIDQCHFTCGLCHKEFFTKIHYQVHSIVHLLPDNFNCHDCEGGFNHILILDKHLELHSNSMSVVCHLCKKEFSDNHLLNVHIKKQHKELTDKSIVSQQSLFRCDKCQVEFPEKHHLDEHHQNICIKKELDSEECDDRESVTSTSVDNFGESDNDDDIDEDGNDDGKTTRKIHNNTVHDSHLIDTGDKYAPGKHVSNDNIQSLFRCDKCQIEFTEKHHLDEHHQNICIKKELDSEECDDRESVTSTSVDDFDDSDNDGDSDDDDNDNDEKRTRKIHNNTVHDSCHNDTGDKCVPGKHVSNDSIQSLFKCDKCQIEFTEKHHLDEHHQNICIKKELDSEEWDDRESVTSTSVDDFDDSDNDGDSEDDDNDNDEKRTRKIHNNTVHDSCHNGTGDKCVPGKHVSNDSIQSLFKCDKCQIEFTEKHHLDEHHQNICIKKELDSEEWDDRESVTSTPIDDFDDSDNDDDSDDEDNDNDDEKTTRKIHNNTVHDSCHNATGDKCASGKHVSNDNIQSLFRCDKCHIEFTEKHHLDEHHQNICIEKELDSEEWDDRESVTSTPIDDFDDSDNDDDSDDEDNDNDDAHDNDSHFTDALNNIENVNSYKNSQIFESVKSLAANSEESQNNNNNVLSQNPQKLKESIREVFQKVCQNKNSLTVPSSTHSDGKTFSCSQCTKTFTKKKLLNAHLRRHEKKKLAQSSTPLDEKTFACNQCEKKFRLKKLLNAHLRTHEEKKVVHSSTPLDEMLFSCKLCDKDFLLKDLTAHLRTHDTKYTCGVCKKDFPSKDKLFTHVHDNALICKVCQMTFSEKSLLAEHHRLNHSSTVCHICHKKLSTRKQLKIHQRIHSGLRPYVCKICSKRFTTWTSLNQHKLTHTGEKPFQCEVCLKNFARKKNLDMHKRIHSGLRPHVCDICLKAFFSQENLRRHKLIHTGEKPFQCESCEASFNQKVNLMKHQQIHQPGYQPNRGNKSVAEPPSCNLCPAGFILKSSGNSRLCIHLENKPFKCDICGRSFSRKTSLRTHQYIHSGQAPYVCDICNKGFRQKPLLKLHQRIHTGEKPFSCETCGKKFRSKSGLKHHPCTLQKHAPFQCDVCQKGFALQNSLDIHYRKHSGERPFVCDLCGQTFKQKPHLKYHLRRIHLKESAPVVGEVC